MNKHQDREQRVTALQKAQTTYINDLTKRAADRPAHKRYLEGLLAAPADALFKVELPAKLSPRAADALIDDVTWCRAQLPEIGQPSPYPAAYNSLRVTDARVASKRTRTPLQRLLTLPQ